MGDGDTKVGQMCVITRAIFFFQPCLNCKNENYVQQHKVHPHPGQPQNAYLQTASILDTGMF